MQSKIGSDALADWGQRLKDCGEDDFGTKGPCILAISCRRNSEEMSWLQQPSKNRFSHRLFVHLVVSVTWHVAELSMERLSD